MAMNDWRHDPQFNLNEDEYAHFCAFLQRTCGIHLGQNKHYLVATRIKRLLKEHKLPNVPALITLAQQAKGAQVKQHIIDAMTTNETFWFRDTYPFDYLQRSLLPKLAQDKPNGIKIWSAACSSGQEPYSISMVIEEHQKRSPSLRLSQADILATDLSSAILDQAKTGLYDRLSMARGLSAERLQQHFYPIDTDNWRIKNTISERVQFRSLNLQSSFVGLGKFDIIFCRNVLIYFSQELKQDILQKLHGQLHKNGILFLGSSEGIAGLNHLFDMVDCNPGVAYRAL